MHRLGKKNYFADLTIDRILVWGHCFKSKIPIILIYYFYTVIVVKCLEPLLRRVQWDLHQVLEPKALKGETIQRWELIVHL